MEGAISNSSCSYHWVKSQRQLQILRFSSNFSFWTSWLRPCRICWFYCDSYREKWGIRCTISRSIGGEVHSDGDFLIFEGNRYSRKGHLYKTFNIGAVVSTVHEGYQANCFCCRLWTLGSTFTLKLTTFATHHCYCLNLIKRMWYNPGSFIIITFITLVCRVQTLFLMAYEL